MSTLPPEHHRVRLETFGCRVNKYDDAVIRAALMARGFTLVDAGSDCDTVVLNTCTVTEAADQATRRLVRGIRRVNPSSRIVLTGCYAQVGGEALRSQLEVDLVVPNQDKDALAFRLERLLQRPPPASVPGPADLEPGAYTRFFLKVQEGCDVRCTFCIIPDARGPARSRPIGEVIAAALRAIERGMREIILAGIHLGAYGRDLPDRSSLGALIRHLLDETPVERVRLGSLEPWGVRPELLELMATQPRLLPSLHLPLQSGCEATLRAMGRPITARRYQQLVEALLEARPDLTLWTDVMAGFPGESDRDFEESLDFVARQPFTRLHVFPYSRRSGTPAASLPDPVVASIKRQRVERLLTLSDQRFQAALQRRVGSGDEVLVEAEGRGHTRDNLPIQLVAGPGAPEPASLRYALVPVRLLRVRGEALEAQALDRSPLEAVRHTVTAEHPEPPAWSV